MKQMTGLLLLVVLVTGCISLGKSKPSDFYVLNSLADSVRAATPEIPPPGIRVGVMKVNLPQTLARPQIVIYPDRNTIHFSEADRWGEPLEDGITRVLMENLTLLIPSRDVYILPARSAVEFERFVAIDVIAFGYMAPGQVELIARWTLYEGDRKTVVAENASRVAEDFPVENPEEMDYRAIAGAMSRNMVTLSREIAAAIQESSS